MFEVIGGLYFGLMIFILFLFLFLGGSARARWGASSRGFVGRRSF